MLTGVMPGPKTPAAALKALHPRPGFEVEQTAAEPLVADPIAMAWGPDGKLWVVEMGDYPLGLDGKGTFGGVVRFLEDDDGDGRYDRSTVFLEGLGFPTGVAPWRKGVLVACAPDIFYAEDTDGDGRADRREVLFTGFNQGNQQHRTNGLNWGLDGWLYCANGDSGGHIKSLKTGDELDLGGRDYRIRPDEGLIDPQLGVSQFGRNRDDWDNWFGCNNSNPMWHFVLADHYLRRNPHVAPPYAHMPVPTVPGAAPVFARSRALERFNDPGAVGRFTSANSAMVYRDELFGPEFSQSTFVSEPVHNLVHREVIEPAGLSFSSHRADDEKQSEFLASSDNWFRPTTLATGPDGALWVCDMYRLVIEHPQWIPKAWQEKLDLRAGADQGRIYRVFPRAARPRPIPRLDKLSTLELAKAIDSPSGWQRDMVHQMLLWKADKSAAAELKKVALHSPRPTARVQALCALDGLDSLDGPTLHAALADKHPGVRRHAVRLAEQRLADDDKLATAVLVLVRDDDPQVRLQLAYSLGEWSDPRAARALAEIALASGADRYLRAAVLSSIGPNNIESVLAAVLAAEARANDAQTPDQQLVEQLLVVATALGDKALPATLTAISKPADGKFARWQLAALTGLVEALDRRKTTLADLHCDAKTLLPLIEFARRLAADERAPLADRLAAVPLVAPPSAELPGDLDALAALLAPQTHAEVQAAAVDALGRLDSPTITAKLLAGWKGYSPALKSKALDVLISRPASTEALFERHREKPGAPRRRRRGPPAAAAGPERRQSAHPGRPTFVLRGPVEPRCGGRCQSLGSVAESRPGCRARDVHQALQRLPQAGRREPRRRGPGSRARPGSARRQIRRVPAHCDPRS